MPDPLPGFAPLLSGSWAVDRAPAGVALPFGVGEQDGGAALVWRISLPSDRVRAAVDLEAAEAAARSGARAQAAALLRLEAFTRERSGSRPHDASAAIGPASAEADLQAGLDDVERGAAPVPFGAGMDGSPIRAVAFEVAERGSTYWQRAVDDLRSAWANIGQFLSGQVTVETDIDGTPLARTLVRWAGDTATVWRRSPEPALAELHQRSFRSAMASRTALLRTIVTVISAAGLLATVPALLATPAGFLLALPAAWRFVNQVLGGLGPQ